MKLKKVQKKLAAVIGASCLALTLFACPAASLPVQAATNQDYGISPISDIISWVYKMEGDSIYRCLFNHSTGEWIGDWIFVCKIPEKAPDPNGHHHN